MKCTLRKSVMIGGRRDDQGRGEPVISNLNKIEVPQSVKNSEYGCRNCLWCGVECEDGSKYQSSNKGCLGYTYYD